MLFDAPESSSYTLIFVKILRIFPIHIFLFKFFVFIHLFIYFLNHPYHLILHNTTNVNWTHVQHLFRTKSLSIVVASVINIRRLKIGKPIHGRDSLVLSNVEIRKKNLNLIWNFEINENSAFLLNRNHIVQFMLLKKVGFFSFHMIIPTNVPTPTLQLLKSVINLAPPM